MPLILYGIRDYDGHVTSIEHVRTDDIPDRVGRENLDAVKYLMFLNDVLSWIKSIVCVDDIAAVYAFQWDPNAPGRGVTANALLRDPENAFLPEWYVNEMEDYFADSCKQRQRKGEKRKMGGETQWEDQEIKMKGMRKRFETSWPRTAATDEPNTRQKDANYARSRSSGFHDISDRGRTTLKGRDATDEERDSRRESFQSGDQYKRAPSRSSREHNARRPLPTEKQFYRDRESHRGNGRQSPPYSHQGSRNKMDKTRRYERRHHEDQVQHAQQGRVRTGKSFNESSSQRFSERSRDYHSSGDDRISQELRVKRVKRDEKDGERRHQAFSRRDYPHWN